MIKSAQRCLLSLVVVQVASLASVAAEPIPPDQFARLQAVIKPANAEDKWAQIPWLIDLWEARKRAAAQGKPILLWEMDGHPLACV